MGVTVLGIQHHFYPRSPCGERHAADISASREASISIHALLAESDEPATSGNDKNNVFLSTLSLRRATVGQKRLRQKLAISIHALLAESDSAPRFTPAASRNFYPRSPCGERPMQIVIIVVCALFLSTLSLRRATQTAYFFWTGGRISIHALLAESDPPRVIREPATSGFLSTLSLRRATSVVFLLLAAGVFLSTLSLRRATQKLLKKY